MIYPKTINPEKNYGSSPDLFLYLIFSFVQCCGRALILADISFFNLSYSEKDKGDKTYKVADNDSH